MTALRDMRNIGDVVAAELEAAGIADGEALRAAGSMRRGHPPTRLGLRRLQEQARRPRGRDPRRQVESHPEDGTRNTLEEIREHGLGALGPRGIRAYL